MKKNNVKNLNINKEIEVVVNDCVIFKGKVTKENFKYVQKMIKLSGGYIVRKEQ